MVSSVTEFVAEILGRSTDDRRIVTYRGHANESFLLKPSIFRSNDHYKNEHILLRELIAAHPDEFSHDASALEILVRMQHYSLPTRLLDVSFNPLVALYFACENASNRSSRTSGTIRSTTSTKADGEVIILSSRKSKVKYFDSDTVSIVTNLARMAFDLKNQIDTSMSKDTFNKEIVVRRLIHFIRQEKVGFEAEIEPEHLDDVFLVKPKQNNRRILAQSGAFFAFGLTQEIVDSSIARIDRITVDAGAKRDIRDQLDRLGINEKTLFPDIERAARYLTGSITASALARLLR